MNEAVGPQVEGTVIRVEGPTAIVRVDGGDLRASLRGHLKSGPRRATHPVATGDRVFLRYDATGAAVIEQVALRNNLIARVDPGNVRRCQAIAANVDQLLCIQAYRDPPLNLRGVDRFLLLGETARIPTTIIVNKSDLLHGRARKELDYYPQIGVPVIETSVRTGEGIDSLGALLDGRITVFVGPSGVGKSSLLNRILPGLNLRTGPISRATSRGVHTTVRVEWIDLPNGGAVLDTPGLRMIQPWGIGASNLAELFPEFGEINDCRFKDCRHGSEPECAVRQAVEAGRLPAFRYDSYRRILVSLEEHPKC